MRTGHRLGITLIVFAVLLLASVSAVFAHGEEGEAWLVSQHEFRDLVLTPDISLPQWSGAKMVTLDQSDGVDVNVMSVHNNTYVAVLIERDFNLSIDKAGVALNFNESSAIWAWVAGQQSLVNDHHVKSMASLNDGMLTVVFGRPLASDGSEIAFKDDTPFSDFVSVITWDNGSALSAISFTNAPTFGLELLPYIDTTPKAPIIYSAVILVAGLGFVFLEARKYRSGKN